MPIDMAEGPMPEREKARILIVDDDERNLLALGQVLKDVGEVVTASSGREALRQLLRDDFAVVLLDVYMPEMDGYEVAGLIRQRRQSAKIPIIFLSAVNKETEHLMRGYAMGAVDYVFKPVDPTVLRCKVSVFVDLFDMRRQIEAKSRAEQELRDANYRAELDRLQIESELQASRARVAAILDALPIALFEVHPEENGALARKFVGGDLSRLVGAEAAAVEAGELTWEDRIHLEDRHGLTHLGAEQDATSWSREYRWHAGDGSSRHFIEQCVRLRGGRNDDRWVGTLFDATERKQLEAQLHQAGKMDAIGQLTGGIAHDFNNLLATVLGGISLLERRTQFEGRERMIIDQMRLAAEKGAELVKRMMAFARKQDLDPGSICPASLCESVAGLVEQTLGGTIRLEWDCVQSERNFYADRSQLELAMLNLIINARDAMPDGGTIHAGVEPASPSDAEAAGLAHGDYLRISVSDDGVGIPPGLIDKITEPFFTTKEVGKGTGLGLSMVVGFVHQSGGKLNIRSKEGKGTTVEILLPSTSQSAPPAEGSAIESRRELAVRSILLIDDDEMVRTIVGEQLREMHIEVVAAADGPSALELLAATPDAFDLILTDFAMPVLDGLQTIDRAREIAPGLRSVIMTGYADDRLSELPGTIDVLRKPIRPEDLRRVCESCPTPAKRPRTRASGRRVPADT